MATQIKLRRDTAANWTANNPTLALGEPGIETDTNKVKYGDGVTAWTSLSYAAAGASTLLSLTDVTGDGTNGQVLTTNGAGSFSFTTVAGGATELDGLSDVAGSVSAGHVMIADGDGTYSFTNTLTGVAAIQNSTFDIRTSSGNVTTRYQDSQVTFYKPDTTEAWLTVPASGDVSPGGFWNFAQLGASGQCDFAARLNAKHYQTGISVQNYSSGTDYLVADPTFGGIWDVTATANFTMDPPATTNINNGDHMDIYITVPQAGNVVMTNNSGIQWLGGVVGRAPNTTETTNGPATSHIRLIRLNSTWYGEFVGVFYTP